MDLSGRLDLLHRSQNQYPLTHISSKYIQNQKQSNYCKIKPNQSQAFYDKLLFKFRNKHIKYAVVHYLIHYNCHYLDNGCATNHLQLQSATTSPLQSYLA